MAIYEKLMGNPFVDAGVCGICEWLGPGVQPEQITTADLEQVVEDEWVEGEEVATAGVLLDKLSQDHHFLRDQRKLGAVEKDSFPLLDL